MNGPVRYKVLGYRKYATVEFPRGTPTVMKPFAAAGGLACDGIVSLLDVPADVVGSFPVTMAHGGPDARGCMDEGAVLCAIMSVFPWYPVIAV